MERSAGGALGLLRIGFFAGMMLLGGVAVFIGVVFLLATGYGGPISISYASKGQTVMETIRQTDDPGRYWRLYLFMGVAPVVLGGLAGWLGYRAFKRG